MTDNYKNNKLKKSRSFSPYDSDAPLYTIEDNEEEDGDYDVSQYIYDESSVKDEDIDDIEEHEEDEEDIVEELSDNKPDFVKPSPMRVLFKTLFTPVEGWKSLKRSRFQTDKFASGAFYPIIILTALSEIMRLFYEANYSFGDWGIDMIITFVTFFFSYFTILLFSNIILPKKSKVFIKRDIGHQFVMLALSTLALFMIFMNIIPMLNPVLVFLPIWTIYLVYKGVRVFRIPEEVQSSTTGMLCLLIIGVPIMWNWVLSEFLLSH